MLAYIIQLADNTHIQVAGNSLFKKSDFSVIIDGVAISFTSEITNIDSYESAGQEYIDKLSIDESAEDVKVSHHVDNSRSLVRDSKYTHVFYDELYILAVDNGYYKEAAAIKQLSTSYLSRNATLLSIIESNEGIDCLMKVIDFLF